MGDWWEIGPYKISRCPIKIVDPGIYDYIRAYRRFERGFLPCEGGWMEQSAKFNDVIDIIENEQGLVQKKTVKEKPKK